MGEDFGNLIGNPHIMDNHMDKKMQDQMQTVLLQVLGAS